VFTASRRTLFKNKKTPEEKLREKDEIINIRCAAGCPTGRRAFKRSPPVLGWAAARKRIKDYG
jgi:hypothetical protein